MRDPRLVEAARNAARHNASLVGRPNLYRCEADPSHIMVTVDREAGVTPFTTQCPHCEKLGTPAPKGTFYKHPAMTSACYNVPVTLVPTHEWFRPDSLEGYSPGMVQHLLQGGLDLRPIQAHVNG